MSIFSSVDSEKRWLVEMHQNFPRQPHTTTTVDYDIIFSEDTTPICVFRVPKTLYETKPEAYTPQYLGLGPYHHLRPELYPARIKRFGAVRKFLGPDNLHNLQKVVDALIELEPVVRSSYDHYLDLDIRTLAWILAVDGLCLLQIMAVQSSETEKFAGDISMFENQIPVVLLKKILELVQLPKLEDSRYDRYLFRLFGSICGTHSPLKLNRELAVLGDESQFHLLHRMYYLIVNNRGIGEFLPSQHTSRISAREQSISVADVNSACGFLAQQGVPGAAVAAQILSFVEKVPWGKIFGGLYEKRNSDVVSSVVEKIDVPSVTQLTETAGIKFTRTSGGIRDIRFDEGEKKFYLPVITLKSTSETILKNLLAFEQVWAKPGTTLELAEYVDLMCGIVDTAKDVGILRKEKIIVSSRLPNEDIARIFNGIGKSKKTINDVKSNIEEAVDGLNKRFNNLCRVKFKRFLGKYVPATFRVLFVVITIAVVVLLTLNAFCSVFGCRRWFRKSAI